MKKIVIFPGWGYPHSFYNFIIEYFKDNYEIEIEDFENFEEKKCYGIIAWSMGILDFFRKEKKIEYEKAILIAPTIDFTLTTSKRVINAMIKGLKLSQEKLLYDFYKNNFYVLSSFEQFYEEYKNEFENLNLSELEKGLEFLACEKSSFPINLKCSVAIYTAEKDIIIPKENSLNAVKNIVSPVEIKEFMCGHNILYEKREEFLESAGRYFND